MDLEAYDRDGLVYTTDLARGGIGARAIARAVDRGLLLRLRRGVYVRPDAWAALAPAARHLLRIRAVAAASTSDPVFAGASAAALWGVPLDDFPAAVTILDRWRGGGRSEPGVTRTARGAASASPSMRLGFRCTSLARTVLDVGRALAFPQAVAVLDWSLWVRNPLRIDSADLIAEASLIRCPQSLMRAIEFATSVSGSVGESEARAVIHQLGYPSPHLQRRFTDVEGDMFPDFYFPDADVAVEFDGKSKYTRDEYTHGDPAEVVWREKKREDRLRRQVRMVVRILTSDVKSPSVLDRKLSDAGIHRASGARHSPSARVLAPAKRRGLPPPG